MKKELIKSFTTSLSNGRPIDGKIIAIIILSNIFCLFLFSQDTTELKPQYVYQSKINDGISLTRPAIFTFTFPDKFPSQIAVALGNDIYIKAFLHQVHDSDSEIIIATIEISSNDLKAVLEASEQTLRLVPYHSDLFQNKKGHSYEISF